MNLLFQIPNTMPLASAYPPGNWQLSNFLALMSSLALFSAPYVVTRIMSDFNARKTNKTTWILLLSTLGLAALYLFVHHPTSDTPSGWGDALFSTYVLFYFWPISLATGLVFAFWMLAHEHESPKAKTFLHILIGAHLSFAASFITLFGIR